MHRVAFETVAFHRFQLERRLKLRAFKGELLGLRLEIALGNFQLPLQAAFLAGLAFEQFFPLAGRFRGRPQPAFEFQLRLIERAAGRFKAGLILLQLRRNVAGGPQLLLGQFAIRGFLRTITRGAGH